MPLEQEVAGLCGEIPGVDRVGIYDHFPELESHSPLAMQLISRVFKAFRVHLSLPTLLESPPVADMAAVIAQHRALTVDQEGIERMRAELEELSDAQVPRLLTDDGSRARHMKAAHE
jgi:hypothetical protein